jgi:predicted DNA binding protein/GAF domain-containing protein
MNLTTIGLHLGLLAVSVATTAGAAIYGWRHRSDPGARTFAGLMLAFTWYSSSHLLGVLTHPPRWRLLLENAQWIGGAIAPVFWLVFAMEYTGYDEVFDRKVLGGLLVVPGLTVITSWTNRWHGLMWVRNDVVVVDGLALLDQGFGPWFWVNMAYTIGLIGIGSLLLLGLIVRSDHLYADQSVLLIVGVAVPAVAIVLSVFETPPLRRPLLDLTPYAFAVTGVSFGGALFRYRLLEVMPATRQIGRRAAITSLDDGVLVLDSTRRIVYCNPEAAAIFDRELSAVLGASVRSLLDATELDFDAEDGPTELDLDDRTFEVRSSSIGDRHDRPLGTTLIVQDVTDRKRRERQLRQQRNELTRLDAINTVIREVNGALVGATTRAEIERTVPERLVAAEAYRAAWVGRGTIGTPDSIEWAVVVDEGDTDTPGTAPDERDEAAAISASRSIDSRVRSDEPDPGVLPESIPDEPLTRGSWTTIPLTHDRIVYGLLVLFSARSDAFGEREVAVLDELGETIGHAINAAESKRTLITDAVVELELLCTDPAAALVGISGRAECRFDLEGLVSAEKGRLLAYLSIEGTPAERMHELATETTGITATKRVSERADGNGALLEVTLADESLLSALTEHGTNVRSLHAEAGESRVVVEVAPEANVRSLVAHLEEAFPATELLSKRELDRPIERSEALSGSVFDDLTDRQREALEAAYRAGYFDWPRESTAEDVAESMAISSPTLHAHLRKAQNEVLDEVFDEHG